MTVWARYATASPFSSSLCLFFLFAHIHCLLSCCLHRLKKGYCTMATRYLWLFPSQRSHVSLPPVLFVGCFFCVCEKGGVFLILHLIPPMDTTFLCFHNWSAMHRHRHRPHQIQIREPTARLDALHTIAITQFGCDNNTGENRGPLCGRGVVCLERKDLFFLLLLSSSSPSNLVTFHFSLWPSLPTGCFVVFFLYWKRANHESNKSIRCVKLGGTEIIIILLQ